MLLYCFVSSIFANKCATDNFKFAYKQKSKTGELRSAAKISFTLCYLVFFRSCVGWFPLCYLVSFRLCVTWLFFTCLLVALFSAVLFDFFAMCSLVSLRHCVSCCLFPRSLVGFFSTVLFGFFPSVLFDSYSPMCYLIFTSRSSLISFAPFVSWFLFSLVLVGFFSRLFYLICLPACIVTSICFLFTGIIWFFFAWVCWFVFRLYILWFF